MTTEPTKVMTAAAEHSYDAYRAAGWSDEQLVAHGLMQPRAAPEHDIETDDRLRLLTERVETLEAEKKAIADDIRDVYAEAKAVGYDSRIMREIVKLRKMRPDDRHEREAILETYKAALGLA